MLKSFAELYNKNNFKELFNFIKCLKLSVIYPLFRYFPVANLTRTRQAVIIEPLRPEKFYVKTFNATSLYILSICEVCGSYQCPYCPFYSGSPSVQPTSIFILILITLTLTWDRTLVRISVNKPSTNIHLWHIRKINDFQAVLLTLQFLCESTTTKS